MFIVDFDDTLFDTNRYKHERLLAVIKCGVSEELFQKTYRSSRQNSSGIFVYSDEVHADALEKEGFEKSKILNAFSSVNKVLESFVFSDTIFFLTELKKTGQPLVLLSLGNPETQEMKVKGSGIHDFFDRVFFTESSKISTLHEIVDHHSKTKIWFFNDKIEETVSIQKEFPFLNSALIQSPLFSRCDYEHCGFPFFSSRKELLNYVRAS